ncbi:MAG: nucleotidyltransferase domain-containing protein [Candidatus Margulisiibacteriota bacterium]
MQARSDFHADQSDIQEMVFRIVAATHPEKVILFGSYARGTEGPDSDVDLLVIASHDTQSRRAELRKIWHALSGIMVPKDVLVYNREDVKKWQDTPNHVISIALKEGKILYEQ